MAIYRLSKSKQVGVRGLVYNRAGHWLDGAPMQMVDKLSSYGSGYVCYANDFTSWDGPTSDGTTAGWIVTSVDGGTDNGEAISLVASATGGRLRITTNDADNDNTVLQSAGEPFQWGGVGKEAWFVCQFGSTDANDGEVFVGLCTADTDPFSTAPTDGFWFEKAETATTMTGVCSKDSTQNTVTGIGATMTDSTRQEYGIHITRAGAVEFYAGGALAGSIGAGNAAICDDDDLKLTFAIQTGGLDTIDLDIDYVGVAFEL